MTAITQDYARSILGTLARLGIRAWTAGDELVIDAPEALPQWLHELIVSPQGQADLREALETSPEAPTAVLLRELAAGAPATAPDLAARLGWPLSGASRLLEHLATLGDVRRMGDRWTVALTVALTVAPAEFDALDLV